MLVPVIGLVQVGEQARADRYTYLPQIGLVIALAWGAKRLHEVWPRRAWLYGVSAPLVIGELRDARVEIRPLSYALGWSHEVVQKDRDQPGAVTYQVSQLTGEVTARRPSGPIYVVYHGRQEGAESVALGFSADGQSFSRISVDWFDQPIPIPAQARYFRFTISAGGALTGFEVIATEAAR
jgi:hypothetical protein